MSLRINTNLLSINAQRHLEQHQKSLSHSQASLASGKRIVSPSDDAAGLAISENLRAQVVGIQMARNNASQGQSLIQVAEGGLNEMSDLLIRVRELGMQSASDTTSKKEKNLINQEAQDLLAELDRISQSTQFGNRKLLDGSLRKGLEYHVGPFAGEENKIKVDLKADARAKSLGLGSVSLTEKRLALRSLRTVDKALNEVNKMRAGFGFIQRRLESTIENLNVQNESLSQALSNIQDTDIAFATAKAASSQILQHAAISTLTQANNSSKAALRLFG